MTDVIFNGPDKEIAVKFGITSLTAQGDLYSRWKEWVLDSDNSKFTPAFRTTAGDPIGPGKEIAPYFFLINGWKIRPHAADHELLITGNLYTDPSTNAVMLPATGSDVTSSFTVLALLERAVDAIAVIASVTQSSLTGQQSSELTATYLATGQISSSVDEVILSQSLADVKLDQLIAAGGALTPEQAAQLTATYLATGDATASLATVIISQSIADSDLDTIILSQSIADGKLDSILAAGGALTPEQAAQLAATYLASGDTTSSLSEVIASQSLADIDLTTIILGEAEIIISQSLATDERAEIITSQSLADVLFNNVLVSQSLADGKLDLVIVSQSLADAKLDTLITAGGALTPTQADQLLRIYELLGLDPTQPLVVTPQARTVSSSISQSIDTSGQTVTVTRTV